MAIFAVKCPEEFQKWLSSLKDIRAFAQITKRLTRIELGNLGDFKPVGEKIFELRVGYGPRDRVY